jgi:hypothetical protein
MNFKQMEKWAKGPQPHVTASATTNQDPVFHAGDPHQQTQTSPGRRIRRK